MARPLLIPAILAAALAALPGCRDQASGPIRVSAIGGAPQLVNPNLQPLDAPSAFLVEAVAEGLVRFDAAGEIEPALAQSWIVSDDGLRYTFRIRRAQWSDGSRVTAQQVVARLRAASSRASRNALKPVLGAIAAIVPMTEQVLEIRLSGQRPNFLELLAQPEMAIMLGGRATGPYRIAAQGADGVRLAATRGDADEEEEASPERPDLLLRGDRAAIAVARFAEGEADLVLGGTAGDLPLARAADVPGNRLVLDNVNGLFGLAFDSADGPLAAAELRRALSMAIDRQALALALNARLDARRGLVPPGIDELPGPAEPDWAASPLAMRRNAAAQAVAAAAPGQRLRLRIAVPDGAGYRIVFAHIRRDWRLVGVEAVRVAAGAPAELRLVDEVAPANLATWYLRHFECGASRLCDPAADLALQAARVAPSPGERRIQLAAADGILTALTPFIPLTGPVRWSLVSPRLTGFRANQFARHAAGELIAERP
jgi:oligopeptide transport system substrate-binding protein